MVATGPPPAAGRTGRPRPAARMSRRDAPGRRPPGSAAAGSVPAERAPPPRPSKTAGSCRADTRGRAPRRANDRPGPACRSWNARSTPERPAPTPEAGFYALRRSTHRATRRPDAVSHLSWRVARKSPRLPPEGPSSTSERVASRGIGTVPVRPRTDERAHRHHADRTIPPWPFRVPSAYSVGSR